VDDVWNAEALNKSRSILGIEYTVFITLLAFGLYLGVEAYNTPTPDPTFAEKIAKLKDVHFEFNKSDLSPDAADLLNSDADILKDIFKQFNGATVILEGYCDDRGTDEYNFALGYKRAEAARQVLLAAQIGKGKLAVSSHGKKESPCQSDDESCGQQYRRVHLTVIQN
jgi:outer membrane protein OmpA-like peptidoglycan-associated protein